ELPMKCYHYTKAGTRRAARWGQRLGCRMDANDGALPHVPICDGCRGPVITLLSSPVITCPTGGGNLHLKPQEHWRRIETRAGAPVKRWMTRPGRRGVPWIREGDPARIIGIDAPWGEEPLE